MSRQSQPVDARSSKTESHSLVKGLLRLCGINAFAATLFIPGLVAGAGFIGTGSMKVARDTFTATLLSNGKVLVAGGSDVTHANSFSSAELYDPGSGTWTTTGSLNASRWFHTATALPNGKVLVVGGASGNISSTVLESSELYDPVSGSWQLTHTGDSRVEHTATLLRNGKVLVAGG